MIAVCFFLLVAHLFFPIRSVSDGQPKYKKVEPKKIALKISEWVSPAQRKHNEKTCLISQFKITMPKELSKAPRGNNLTARTLRETQITTKPFTLLRQDDPTKFSTVASEFQGAFNSNSGENLSSAFCNIYKLLKKGCMVDKNHVATVRSLQYVFTNPLMLATLLEDSELIPKLLGQNPNLVQTTDFRKRTALHWAACRSADLAVFQQLIAGGINVNQQDDKGNSALHNAVKRNLSSRVIETILRAGALVNTKNWKDETPAAIAKRKKCASFFDAMGQVYPNFVPEMDITLKTDEIRYYPLAQGCLPTSDLGIENFESEFTQFIAQYPSPAAIAPLI
jgi:hypothetical protein